MENAGEAQPRCTDLPSSFFRCKICALLPGEIDTLHGHALYEAIKRTVRPAFVFRGKSVVWNLMLMSILMANSKENISKSYFFSLVSTC